MEVDKLTSEQQEQLYDRQIRLWGAEAQKNLQKANILIIGLSGLGSEIVKNVILSGVNSMTLIDNRILNKVPAGELQTNLLIPYDIKYAKDSTLTLALASLARCQELNPNVETIIEQKIDFQKIENSNFSIVVCSDQTKETEIKSAKACSTSNTPFLTGSTLGYFGISILDPGRKFTCQVKKLRTKQERFDETERVKTVTEEYYEIEDLEFDSFFEIHKKLGNSNSENAIFGKLSKREFKNLNQAIIVMLLKYENLELNKENFEKKSLELTGKENFWTNLNKRYHNLEKLCNFSAKGQLSAITAIVGGFMAQEVIRICSKKEAPFDNLFLFDGINYKGDVMKV